MLIYNNVYEGWRNTLNNIAIQSREKKKRRKKERKKEEKDFYASRARDFL